VSVERQWSASLTSTPPVLPLPYWRLSSAWSSTRGAPSARPCATGTPASPSVARTTSSSSPTASASPGTPHPRSPSSPYVPPSRPPLSLSRARALLRPVLTPLRCVDLARQVFDGHNGVSAAVYSKEHLLEHVMSALPPDIDREDWLQALPRALVAGFVKADIDFQRKGECHATAQYHLQSRLEVNVVIVPVSVCVCAY
jgi:hypothetical protein